MKNFAKFHPILSSFMVVLLSPTAFAESQALPKNYSPQEQRWEALLDLAKNNDLTTNVAQNDNLAKPSHKMTDEDNDKKLEALAKNMTWQRLLFIKNGKSTIEDPSFFLANGNPNEEIKALWQAMQEPSDMVWCRFPARTKFVASHMGVAAEDGHCRDFLDWQKSHDATSLALVFAEEHPNVLGSAFAHVMMKATDANGKNMAVNYTVDRNQSDSEGVASLKSMAGKYAGVMEFFDYEEKRDVYLKNDGRDVWEYELDLTADEVFEIMRHIWEIKDIKRPYFFTHDNCATEILRLIDLVRPNESLRKKAGKVVIPNEVARLLSAENMVKKTNYLPSDTTIAQAKINADFHHKAVNDISTHHDPSHASPTHKIGLSVGHGFDGQNGDGAVYGISAHSAYQDLLDPTVGVRDYLDLKILSMDLEYKDKLELSKAVIFSTRSYNPKNTAKAHNGKAWGQHLQLIKTTDASDGNNDEHLVLEARLEKGVSWTLGQGAAGTGDLSDAMCYVLGGYGGQIGKVNKGYRVGVGVNAGCAYRARDDLRVLGEIGVPVWYHYGVQDGRDVYVQPFATLGVQYDFNPKNAVRVLAKIQKTNGDEQGEIGMQYLKYF